MKSKLLLLALFITSISFAQRESLTLTDIITINANNHNTSGTALTVPNGKLWVVNFQADTVLVDNVNASYAAIEHLIHNGARRIGFIGGSRTLSNAQE